MMSAYCIPIPTYLEVGGSVENAKEDVLGCSNFTRKTCISQERDSCLPFSPISYTKETFLNILQVECFAVDSVAENFSKIDYLSFQTLKCFVKMAAMIWAFLQLNLSILISADVCQVLWPANCQYIN